MRASKINISQAIKNTNKQINKQTNPNQYSLYLDFLLFLSWKRGHRNLLSKEVHFRSPRANLRMFQKPIFHFMGTTVSGKIMPSVWLLQLVGLVKADVKNCSTKEAICS